MKKIFVLCTAMLLFFNPVFGQDGELFLSLERFMPQKGDFINEAVVEKDKIENKNTPAAVDLISSVTGVFVTKAASQIKSDVSIRGLGDSFRRIGLFIDGRPEKMAVYGCGVSQTLLSGNVERVEITKGPDSVLYGSDGFGGVVNIITASAIKPFEASIAASYGTYNTQNYNLDIGGDTGKFSYYGAVNKASSDGHITGAGYNADDYYVKAGYKIDDFSEITAGGKYFTGTENEPVAKTVNRAGGIDTAPGSRYDFKRGGADIKYRRDLSNGEVSLLLFGDFGEHEFSTGFSSKDSIYGVFLHFSNEIFYNNTLKYGAEYRLSAGKVMTVPIPQMAVGEWKKSEAAVFALDEYILSHKAKIFAGLRYNYDEISGDSFSPRAGASYNITEMLAARAIYSKGFRTPYLNELYTLPSSNKDLKPEELDSYEIGINSNYLDINFDMSAFVMNGDNIIQLVAVPGTAMSRFQNSGAYVFKGAEISAEYEIVKNLKGYAGYSYLNPGDFTSAIAKNKADVSLDYKIGKFSLYVGGMFVFDYYASNQNLNNGNKLNDFNVFNAKIHYAAAKSLTIFAAADNFTDQKYDMFIVSFGDARIYEMPGSTFTLGAKYSF